jgi:NADPH:quinone reductase-like Zn-dependent oxidoreductase
MKAAILRRYGPSSELECADMPAPAPGPGQLLVRVHASSVNPLDVKLRDGSLRRILPLTFPAVLGFDFAGEIDSSGSGVTGWRVGERVYGRVDAKTGGAHAELVAVAASVTDLIPERLSFEEAAALPLVGMTALQALRRAGLAAGEHLLVNGAAGGVGSIAVQLGREFGADVTGVCSIGAAALVAKLGARVIDYTKGELDKTTERFDVILDTVFNRPTDALLRVLARRGRYVTTGFSVQLLVRSMLRRITSGQQFGFVISKADGELMRSLSAEVAGGRLVPVVDTIFSLSQIAAAHERVERGHVHGKVIVRIP